MLNDFLFAHRTLKGWLASRRLRRRFRTAQKFTLSSMPEDTTGKVRGHAHAIGEPLVAPISQRPCVYWVVEVLDVPYSPQERPALLARDQHGGPFSIVDAGWHGIVDPSDAEVSLVFDHTGTSKAYFDATRDEKALLQRAKLETRDWSSTNKLEYREAVIEINEAVSVLGSGTREPDPDASPGDYRDGGRTRLLLTSSQKYPLAITDDPRCV